MATASRIVPPPQKQLGGGQYFGHIVGNRRSADLVLTEVSHTIPKSFGMHSHELAFFSLLLEGGYTEYCGSKTIEYKPTTVVFRGSGLMHHDQIGRSGVRLFNVEVRQSMIERMREECSPTRWPLDPQGGEVAWLAARLYREFKEPGACSSLAIEGLALQMLASLSRVAALEDKQAPDWLARVKDLLHAEYNQNIGLGRIATEVDVHPLRLSKAFRKFQGQTIAEYIQQLRVNFACKELVRADADLAAVAAAAGFSDQSHFTRIFKRVTGMTPGVFRSVLTSDKPRGSENPGDGGEELRLVNNRRS